MSDLQNEMIKKQEEFIQSSLKRLKSMMSQSSNLSNLAAKLQEPTKKVLLDTVKSMNQDIAELLEEVENNINYLKGIENKKKERA